MNTSEEVWKPVIEFPDDYEVSDLGRVRSIDRDKLCSDGRLISLRGKILHQTEHKTVLYRIRLCVERVKYTRSVHRMIAEAFIPNPQNKPEVNHKDGNRLNNKLSNLEWVTKKENMDHAVATGLIDNPYGSLSRNYHGVTRAWRGEKCYYEMHGNKEITEAGFCYKLVSACILGKQNTHKGYTFTRGDIL